MYSTTTVNTTAKNAIKRGHRRRAKVPDSFPARYIAQILWPFAYFDPKYHVLESRIYPLTKLLVIAVRQGICRVIKTDLIPIQKSLEQSTFPNKNYSDQKVAWLQKIIHVLTGVTISTSEAINMNEDAMKLAAIANSADQKTRKTLYKEPYLFTKDNLILSKTVQISSRNFYNKQNRAWHVKDSNPFVSYCFTKSPYKLKELSRMPCTNCGKSVHLYCAFCMCLVLDDAHKIPAVVLPVSFEIVHHPEENIKKSTSIHACLLAPGFCFLREFPDKIPRYDPKSTVLLYPTEDSMNVEDLDAATIRSISQIVVIESTWTKAHKVVAHPHVQALRRIRIRDCESTYWRNQELGRSYLSTLEAIYHTARQFDLAKQKKQKYQRRQNEQEMKQVKKEQIHYKKTKILKKPTKTRTERNRRATKITKNKIEKSTK